MKYVLLALLLLVQQGRKDGFWDASRHEATRKFSYNEFLVVPVRVHLTEVPEGVELRVGTTASVLVMTGERSGDGKQAE